MILVAGATGRLGGLIARSLLSKGESVRALVRDPTPAAGLTDAGATLAFGDLRDTESLIDACAGVTAVVTTANSMARGGADTVDTVDAQGNVNLIDAAARAGVERFVFISALGADDDSPMPLLRAKAEAEKHLRASGIPATILQPNSFMEMLLAAVVGGPALNGQPVTLVGEGQRRHSHVSMKDVTAYSTAVLDHDETVGQTLAIGGPEPVSWRDVIVAFERELGRSVPVNYVPVGSEIPGMPPFISQLLAALEMYDSPIDMAELSARLGVRPTSIEAFAHRFVSETAQHAS
jgi:uncharacterized protein YbjT (DUF2867 family)